MSLLSPGVEIIETDASLVVNTASSSFGAFCGVFSKGPCNGTTLISNVSDLERIYGYPTSENYNDWFQAYCFLRRAGSLYVVRAIDGTGIDNKTEIDITSMSMQFDKPSSLFFTTANVVNTSLFIGAKLLVGNDETIRTVINANWGNADEAKVLEVEVEPEFENTSPYDEHTPIYLLNPSMNAVAEVNIQNFPEDLLTGQEYIRAQKATNVAIANDNEFDFLLPQIKFTNGQSKLKFIARTVGSHGNSIRIAVANPIDFELQNEVTDGLIVNDLFEYYPSSQNHEVGIIIADQSDIVETYLVSLLKGAKDYNNKSMFIEDVINRQSQYVYVKCNTNTDALPVSAMGGSVLSLQYGNDGKPNEADIISGYVENFQSKEEIDIDIVISNEKVNREVAEFTESRGDCVCYIGGIFEDLVGLKAEKCVENLLEYRSKEDLNIDNSYASFIGSYGYIYDKYNDKYRWINLAGATAGLRAATNSQRYPWYASAGLNMGQYMDIIKLAFSPNSGQRDIMYKNGINPVVSFPNLGICLWGQKTLTLKPSAFDRVNVRMLFNYLERNISNSARYIIFEQNNSATQNQFVSMVTPLLEMCKSSNGIEDYKVVCDDTNNTPLVKANNRFVANILVKPLYAIEYISLIFTCVGATVSFEEAIAQ